MSPLPYAPRRKRPLSLWNPLDYLVLLYWVFYFPQALRWYVETFGAVAWETGGWKAIRQDGIQRRLAMQGLLLASAMPLPIAFLLRGVGIDIDFFGLAAGLAVGVAVGVIFGVVFGVVFGLEFGVAVGVAVAVALPAFNARLDAALPGTIPAIFTPRAFRAGRLHPLCQPSVRHLSL